jgi:lysine 2,3-aminomutase
MKQENLEKIAISVRSQKMLQDLLAKNPKLEKVLRQSNSVADVLTNMKKWVDETIQDRPFLQAYFKEPVKKNFDNLQWSDIAAMRIEDYINHSGRKFEDLNRRGAVIENNPFKLLWLAVHQGTGGAKPAFFEDMIHLFNQFSNEGNKAQLSRETIAKNMKRFPHGLEDEIIKIREQNRDRIIDVIIDKIDKGMIKDKNFSFDLNMSHKEKHARVLEWWKTKRFHLRFAVRDPDDLNEMLGHSLDQEMMQILYDAKAAGIPTFVNPYYLSLLTVCPPNFAAGADQAIRDYILYSKQLVDEFGHIVAWEKEDQVEPGKPNAAGWILPFHHSIHRRYPEVAIIIPDTMGRACGGLCSSCQRMYDFQSGHLNFDLEKLKPAVKWKDKLKLIMDYFENDAQLRDILITGGDALMSSDVSMKQLLDAIYDMAVRKHDANKNRKSGEKYAQILRIRLGTRLLAYLPQRVTPELVQILADFKQKASQIGIRQFVIQTHFESPMEITPESKKAITGLLSAGWIITNQLVFSASASRRGHTAQLRRILNDVGVLPYYTFCVKGYMENYHNFAPLARLLQEQFQEKHAGIPPEKYHESISKIPENAESAVQVMNDLREQANLLFLATDRSVLNLPGVGKSFTFRVIGITNDGRRILEFDHDSTRRHSPIINKMGKIVIIESKTIREYLDQLVEMGENEQDYESIYGFSTGITEQRMPLYEYPEYNFEITDKMTNLEI